MSCLDRPSRSGSNAIEFALVLPVFVLLLVAIIDFGWLFFIDSTLDQATVVGCRAGSLINPGIGESDIEDVRRTAELAMEEDLLRSGGGACTTDCSFDVSLSGDPPGRSMFCEVERDFVPLVGFVVSPLTLTSAIAVRMEWQQWPAS
ncbi:MAG: hypothetical protein ACI9VR_000446 [Cognaticolwellia sp.]|jgi:hypothetical protein